MALRMGLCRLIWLAVAISSMNCTVHAWFMDQGGALILDAKRAIECTNNGQVWTAVGGVRIRKGRAIITGDTLVFHRHPVSANVSTLSPPSLSQTVSLSSQTTKAPPSGPSLSDVSSASLKTSDLSGTRPSTKKTSPWMSVTISGHVVIQHPQGQIRCDQATYDVTKKQWRAQGKCIRIHHTNWSVECSDGVVHCDLDQRILTGRGTIVWSHPHTHQRVVSRHVELFFAPVSSGGPGNGKMSLGLGPVKRIRCLAPVTFWSPKFHGQAGCADYDLTTHVIDLSGGVRALFGPHLVCAPRAQWNIPRRTLFVPPTSPSSLQALIDPHSVSSVKKAPNAYATLPHVPSRRS